MNNDTCNSNHQTCHIMTRLLLETIWNIQVWNVQHAVFLSELLNQIRGILALAVRGTTVRECGTVGRRPPGRRQVGGSPRTRQHAGTRSQREDGIHETCAWRQTNAWWWWYTQSIMSQNLGGCPSRALPMP